MYGERFVRPELMRTAVFNYIDYNYNSWPRHSACGGLSPQQLKTRTSLKNLSTLCVGDQFVDC